jgi:hypothetical protein
MNMHDLFNKVGHEYPNRNSTQDNSFRDNSTRYRYDKQTNLLLLLEKIKKSRKIRILLGVLVFIVIAVLAGITILLYPILIKLIHYVGQNGLQGVLDGIASLFDKLLNESK